MTNIISQDHILNDIRCSETGFPEAIAMKVIKSDEKSRYEKG